MAFAEMDMLGAPRVDLLFDGAGPIAAQGRGESEVLPFPLGRDPADVGRARDQRLEPGWDGDELFTRYERDEGVLWCYFRYAKRPCFSRSLLGEIHGLQRDLRRRYGADVGTADGPGPRALPLRYMVWASATPGVYNLGGDLELFARLIRARDVAGLREYARAVVDTCYLNAVSLGLPLVTVHLVQGDALGGGFEAVLSSDVIIAEEGSQFGLPEVLFGMFPGMGAYSFLSRRVGAVQAERMILSGKVYRAEELAEMGVVDVLAPAGEGEAAVRAFVAENRRRHAMRSALFGVRRRCNPVSYEELLDVTELWIETALRLDEADLRRMDRLVAAQLRRRAREAGAGEAHIARAACSG